MSDSEVWKYKVTAVLFPLVFHSSSHLSFLLSPELNALPQFETLWPLEIYLPYKLNTISALHSTDSYFLSAVLKEAIRTLNDLHGVKYTLETTPPPTHTHTDQNTPVPLWHLLSSSPLEQHSSSYLWWAMPASTVVPPLLLKVLRVYRCHSDTSPICALMHTPWLGFNL